MQFWSNFLSGAGGAALVTGIFLIIKWFLDRRAQKKDREGDQQIATCSARGKEILTLKKMVGNLIIADRTILYDRIKYLAKAHIKKGYITIEDYEDLKAMHAVYHNELEGNGFLDGLMVQVERLEKRVL